MSVVQDALQAVMKKAIALAPDGWIPGGHPDPLMHHKHGLIGASISRIDGPLKVAGKAAFCAEFPMEGLAYAALKYSTIARGRIGEIDVAAAEAAPGVVLVMTYRNAPKLNPAPPFMSKPKAAGPDDLPTTQDDRTRRPAITMLRSNRMPAPSRGRATRCGSMTPLRRWRTKRGQLPRCSG